MVSLPVEVLVGISLGLVLGVVPASLAGLIGFSLEQYVDRSLPQFAAVLLTLPLAGGLGYLASIVQRNVNYLPRYVIASFVVVMITIYANSQGQKLAHRMPTDLADASRSERTLSEEAADDVDGLGQVTIRPTGDVGSLDGYPAVGPKLAASLSETAWRLPADLPLSEIETRLADDLRSTHDLAAIAVSVDARGRATIDAAPQSKDLARRVPEGHRAVSVAALAPTNLSPGDHVSVDAESSSVAGTVVSVGEVAASGPERRVTVAVPTADARVLLEADGTLVVAHSNDTSHEYEALSYLKRAGETVREVTLDAGLVDAVANESVDMYALAVEADVGRDGVGGWSFDPTGDDLVPGRAAFLVGDATAMAASETADETAMAASETAEETAMEASETAEETTAEAGGEA
ncbi:potassium transporter TrkA [Halorubellus sp. JP-L1]|uniref:potassium transporter TrkA n=1 Tax=Halorubellus sp. JP-L1 TaxID=2715753 RepID=UPI00140CED63|nr:potassium transporter TrkA [Halorubellus sp. JP-L1]NHN40940.1 potassium transporter TrkA [Halorubellus sp. JP-L1]